MIFSKNVKGGPHFRFLGLFRRQLILWIGIGCLCLSGCGRDVGRESDAKLHLFLALTIQQELVMYEKGVGSEIADSPTFFMIEAVLQENLLRGVYVTSNPSARLSKEASHQLNAALDRAQEVLKSHPIRTIWPLRSVEREFHENEAILPTTIFARKVFEDYFGVASLREIPLTQ